MTYTRWFNKLPTEEVRKAWLDWFRQYSISPDDIVIPGFIEIDPDTRRVTYLAYDLTNHGHRFPAPCGTRANQSVRTVQLEEEPSGWPEM